MRKFLLDDTDFGKFPPKRRYINGIPIVTFQGMCIDIDTQMYGITGSYNVRCVGSLAAETTVGVLQSPSPVSQVSIKARDVPALMNTLVDVMTCKINTDRGFYMRTSKSSGVYPVHEGEVSRMDISTDQCSSSPVCYISSNIVPRDHHFDEPERQNVVRKIKFGSISNPSEPSRGALSVRQYHRKDESKILPTKRLRISVDF
ncbi:uncharacterized protein LOC134281410 [Saccostrea cucullata]|uniref:uncharacterized protein LOC134281410 n=1 Tax=Saccostrea cuccullata TaxID=36930 RepID=UPI002ED3B707